MLQINLLPQIKKDEILSKRSSLFISGFIIPLSILIVLVFFLLFMGYYFLNIQKNNYTIKLAQAESEKTGYSKTQDQVKEFNDVLGLVKKLSEYKTDWTKILAAMAAETPGNVQISRFSFDPNTQNPQANTAEKNQTTKQKTVYISGLSTSYRSIILFQQKLSVSDEFQNPSFISATTNEDKKITFEISAELKNVRVIPQTQTNQPQTNQESTTGE